MAKEKTISMQAANIKADSAIRYDYHPGGEFGDEYQEEYLNVFRGNKHIFISRYFDEGDHTPRFCIVEIDLETGEKLAYQAEFKDSLKANEHELKSYKLEKKALLESNI